MSRLTRILVALALLATGWSASLPPASAQVSGIINGGTPIVGGTTGQCVTRGSNGTVAMDACSAGSVTTWSGGTTGLTPSSATAGAVSLAGTLVGANGGTGVANTGKTITLGGNLTTSGAFNSTFIIPGTGSWTFPAINTTLLNTTGSIAGLTGTIVAGQFPALTGDVTTVVGELATTLASVATAGTTGSSTAIPVITIDAKGRTTGITTAAVVAPAGTLTGATLASGVTASSLTSLGTITSLLATRINGQTITAGSGTLTLGSVTLNAGAGGTLGSNAFTSTAYLPLAGGTLTGDLSISGAAFGVSGDISAPTWTTSGVRYKNVSGTLTDTTAATGTTATAYTNVWGGSTIAATNSGVIFTNYFNSYFKAPVAGTNVTLTNAWSLGADSLKVGTSGTFQVSAAGVLTTTGAQLTTPTLGAAVGTTLALGGATIGSNALAVTGTSIYSGIATFSNDVVVSGNNAVRAPASTQLYVYAGSGQPMYLGAGNNSSLWRLDTTGQLYAVSGGIIGFNSASTLSSGALDTLLSRVSAGVIGVGLTAAGQVTGAMQMASITMGSSSLTLTTGALGLSKMTASASAPGAGGAKLEVVCGTAAGSLKIQISGGTSTTSVSVADNIGSGATGC